MRKIGLDSLSFVICGLLISCSFFSANSQIQTTQPCKVDLSQYQELELVDVSSIHPKYIEFIKKQIQSATYEIDMKGITRQMHPWGVSLTIKTTIGNFTFYGVEDDNGIVKAKYVPTTQASN